MFNLSRSPITSFSGHLYNFLECFKFRFSLNFKRRRKKGICFFCCLFFFVFRRFHLCMTFSIYMLLRVYVCVFACCLCTWCQVAKLPRSYTTIQYNTIYYSSHKVVFGQRMWFTLYCTARCSFNCLSHQCDGDRVRIIHS